jgi:hypothetical protein
VEPLGFNKNSDTILARDLAPDVVGCVGYLKSGTLLFVSRLLVQFKHVERIHEELVGPLRGGYGKSLPRYYPTVSYDLYELKYEQSADPHIFPLDLM